MHEDCSESFQKKGAGLGVPISRVTAVTYLGLHWGFPISWRLPHQNMLKTRFPEVRQSGVLSSIGS